MPPCSRVAHEAGSTPGLRWGSTRCCSKRATSPRRRGSTDLTDEQLGDLAVTQRARPQSVKEVHRRGQDLDEAKAGSATSSAAVAGSDRQGRAPVDLKDGAAGEHQQCDWLTDLPS